MRQIKKTLSIFMAALFVMAGVLGNITVKAATVVVPEITYVGISHSPLVVGDTETFTVASKFEGKVQYRAFLYNGTEWNELTKGYGEAVDAKTPYVLPETAAFKLGAAKLSVWVKRAGETGIQSNANGDFDKYYVANLNCVSKDDANRVYANGDAKVETNGLTVKFNGIENIGGIAGPYLYRMHIYNPTTGVWTNRVTDYTATPSYTFEKAGTYMVVVHANTANSTTWKKYQAETDKTVKNQSNVYGTYEAWKTVMVTVSDSTVKVFDTTVKAATFGATVNVTMTAEGVKNFTTAAKYQILDGTKAVSAITNLATPTTVFPAKVEGDKVNVKLFDITDKEITTIAVALGQSGTITVTAPVDPSKVDVKATVKAATFGATVTVTSTEKTMVKYQVLDGTKAISAITEIGAPTTVFPGKSVGDKVNVKLMDAAGKETIKEVALVAAQ
ncbi:hypothetical protein LGK97_07045 [Clostridium sp. CS001]|uniref:hypothetical protein n=1 Tax=Clostridium sp. CS001 TaxID=2880648 RepID=UPI001CF1EE46|nr:hypothetical protein [Clostridium sp. CS001]MCB2289521.1 hypothetical protein [Clostridium sp. CS001]